MPDSQPANSLRTLVLKGNEVLERDLVSPILDLDRENMEPVLAESGQEFPLAKRLENLCDPLTSVVLLLEAQELAGYLEFRPDFDSPQDIYISSIQLREAYRHGRAFAILVSEAVSILESRPFRRFRMNVHRTNRSALGLFSKLGFEAVETTEVTPMLCLVAERTIIGSSVVRRLSESVERS